MEGESSKRRSVRQAITRKRSVYVEPETDDDFTLSDGNNDSSMGDQPERSVKKAKNETKPKKQKQSQPQTRSKAVAKAATARKSPLKASTRKSRSTSKLTKPTPPTAPPIPSDNVIPNWHLLPYAILAQIFAYAYAAELVVEDGIVANRRQHHPNTWIMRTARKVCCAFTEPALSAYYQSPNLLSNRWLEDLSALVKLPREHRPFQYRNKVKRLEVSARHLDSRTKDGTWTLIELIARLPQLSELIITHPQDEVPFEPRVKNVRWKYPSDLFDAIESSKTKLVAWGWNRFLLADPDSMANMMKDVHLKPSFQNLKHLSIGQLPLNAELQLGNMDDPVGVDIGKAISLLPKLESLTFNTCDSISDQMLSHLPGTLQRLRVVNCMTMTSDMLHDFLSRDGSGSGFMKELVLNHNPCLDLAFLTSLRTICPNLVTLKMDLYDHRENHFRHYAEPKYDALLVEDETPSWPSKLQTLELVHLQKWGAEAAQNLFRSVVESADSLPDLRTLVLYAHINISWRDRAAFRDQWIERLRRVYQRYSDDPDPHLVSLKAFRMWTDSQMPSAPGGRRLSHVAISPRKGSPISLEQDQPSDSDPSKRRSKRISDQVVLQASMPEEEIQPTRSRGKGRRKRGRSDSDAISVRSNKDEAANGNDWRNTPEKFVQGLCDVVDIRIDNQRPREEQLNESHFMDSEASGDEEWTEGAEVEDDRHAW